jgi:hypothetical protein
VDSSAVHAVFCHFDASLCHPDAPLCHFDRREKSGEAALSAVERVFFNLSAIRPIPQLFTIHF